MIDGIEEREYAHTWLRRLTTSIYDFTLWTCLAATSL